MQWLQDTFTALTTAETSSSEQEQSEGVEKSAAGNLQAEGQLSKEQLLNFFEDASKCLRSEEYRRKLKDAFLLKQASP
jgi:hypothetical protein